MFYTLVAFKHVGLTWEEFITQSSEIYYVDDNFFPFMHYENSTEALYYAKSAKQYFPSEVFSVDFTLGRGKNLLNVKDGYSIAMIEYTATPDTIFLSVNRIINLTHKTKSEFEDIIKNPDAYAKQVTLSIEVGYRYKKIMWSPQKKSLPDPDLNRRIAYVLEKLSKRKLKAVFAATRDRYIYKGIDNGRTVALSFLLPLVPVMLGAQALYHVAKSSYYFPTQEDFEKFDSATILMDFFTANIGDHYRSLKYLMCEELFQITMKFKTRRNSDDEVEEDVWLNNYNSRALISEVLRQLTIFAEKKSAKTQYSNMSVQEQKTHIESQFVAGTENWKKMRCTAPKLPFFWASTVVPQEEEKQDISERPGEIYKL